LMSAAVLETGGPMMGEVNEYLASLDVEYCALRPSWFFGAPRFLIGKQLHLCESIDRQPPSPIVG
jgi:hypothetical protein